MELGIVEIIGIAAAGFAAATINAIAGGGTLVSFPALIAVGYSSKVANITNTVGILPGYAGGALAYRSELSRQPENIRDALVPTLAGAVAGSAILLSTPESIFDAVVPFLVLGACGLLAFQDNISAFFFGKREPGVAPPRRKRVMQAGVFLASIYGAYFGAGLGIIVLATLGITLPDDIQRSNALKGVISLIINALAAGYFAIFGEVAWEAVAIIAVAALLGGYAGGRLARRLKRETLRKAVIAYGTLAAIILFVR